MERGKISLLALLGIGLVGLVWMFRDDTKSDFSSDEIKDFRERFAGEQSKDTGQSTDPIKGTVLGLRKFPAAGQEQLEWFVGGANGVVYICVQDTFFDLKPGPGPFQKHDAVWLTTRDGDGEMIGIGPVNRGFKLHVVVSSEDTYDYYSAPDR